MKRLFEKYQRWWREHPMRWWLILLVAVIVSQVFGFLSLSEAIQILLVFTLVVVTWGYALETRRIARASEEATSASLRPIIVMGRDPSFRVPQVGGEIFALTKIFDRTWLRNVGPGPAMNLRFSLEEPNRINPSGHLSGTSITAFGPGETYELVIENVFGQVRWCSHDLLVEYEDVFGNKWCSGLELSYTSGANHFAVLKLFHEKMREDELTKHEGPK